MGKGHEGLSQIKKHPTSFIGCADGIIFSTKPGIYDSSQVFSGGQVWDCLSVRRVNGREGVSYKMGGVTNWKVLAFGWVEVYLPILGPTGSDVKGVLEGFMAVTGGGDDFDVICVESAIC